MTEEIRDILIDAILKAGYNLPVGFAIERPPKSEMGDFASNVAMLIAKAENLNPREAAEQIIKHVKNDLIAKSEAAGPGFINLFVKEEAWLSRLEGILTAGSHYGKNEAGKGKTVNVEYISANPTGPVHIGNARGGPIGEAIANLLRFCGYKVTRSFYVNDIGGQIDKLAASFYYWYEELNGQAPIFPEGGYPGGYVKEATEKVIACYSKELKKLQNEEEFLEFFKDKGVKAMVERIKDEVSLLGIVFDEWIYQSELEKRGGTEVVLNLLQARGSIVEREGASWFKNPDDPEFMDSEAVLRKSDAEKTLTYFADDIACHKHKIDQGADMMVDIWGSNHHGHIPRMKAAMQAVGIDPSRLQILLYQNVRIKNGEEIIKMSKREGNFVLLADVIKFGVGGDVFKFFVLNQNYNTPFDFDIKLAMEKSEKNPVYYVQYAYARIHSLLKKAGEHEESGADLKLLRHPREIALIKELARFPELVAQAEKDMQMQVFPHYSATLASMFHEFYNDCRVIGENEDLARARLALIRATRIVLKQVLDICDIAAPERM